MTNGIMSDLLMRNGFEDSDHLLGEEQQLETIGRCDACGGSTPAISAQPPEPDRWPLPEHFVLIRGGSFMMGSPEDESGRNENETLHEVVVSDFAICRYAVTVGEYLAFAFEMKSRYPEWLEAESACNIQTGTDEHYRSIGDALTGERYPVVGVSWDDAMSYCRWLSENRGGTYRLPTEAEWEYACRGRTTTPFSTGEFLTTEQANFNGEYPYRDCPKGEHRGRPLPVDAFQPNDYGLYAMHGNVREWCSDRYGVSCDEAYRRERVVVNPQGSGRGLFRVLRGGAWNYHAQNCRSACRFFDTPDYRNSYSGFRIVFVL